jgi:hypothetical protein
MTINRALIALGTTLVLAAFGTAEAATSTTQHQATQATCDALQKQAASVLAAHAGDAKAKAAQEQRDKGEKECKAGNYAKGSDHLRKAITDLGMNPVN